ncbi:6431_t:CDS:2, partial [Acaulospora colombiana]
RLLAHGAVCKSLDPILRNKVSEELRKDAPGNLAEDVLKGSESKKRKIDVGEEEDGEDEPNNSKACRQPTIEGIAKIEGKKRLDALVNAAVVNLFCVAGLSDSLADSPFWKHLLQTLNPKYDPVSSTTLRDKHIPAEAERYPQSVYTFHVTTPDRRTFFVDGDEASSESHTADYIWEQAQHVIEMIGPKRFSGVCSDNTGNTKKARRLICNNYPWIINTLDSPHFLARTLSDICNLDVFSETINTTRGVLTFFSHSTHATTHLTSVRKSLDISRGLERIGKTRFGTIYHSSNSILRCAPAIEKLVKDEIINSK